MKVMMEHADSTDFRAAERRLRHWASGSAARRSRSAAGEAEGARARWTRV